jgi:hypothetical protein
LSGKKVFFVEGVEGLSLFESGNAKDFGIADGV